MSRASEGIVLAPMKGSEMIKQHQESLAQGTGTVPRSMYVLPSKRLEEEKKSPKPLTAEQLGSESSFPSLAGAKPMTKSASWSQLRARLCTPDSPKETMKEVIDASLKKKEEQEEEAQRNEGTTDPFLMSREMLERTGWVRLPLKIKNRHEWFARSSYARDPVPCTDDLFL